MKKNVMMRVASALLVAVLLTTCAISGTFAKYVNTDDSTDTARVAYWGWGSTDLDITGLFETSYDIDEDPYDVVSAVDVIAPGTANDVEFGFLYIPNGTITAPEVAYKFEVVATANADTNYELLDANENFKWTLDSNKYDTVADLLTAIDALSQDRVEAGHLPTQWGQDATHTIGWVWDYSADEAGDVADTAMGNATTLDNVTITITITATQLGD